MTSPQGMDELFWGRDHKDVNDWAEWLTMAAEVLRHVQQVASLPLFVV